MARSRECPNCGYELNHLEGVTGRISMCARCGWNKVVLAAGRREQAEPARRAPSTNVQRVSMS